MKKFMIVPVLLMTGMLADVRAEACSICIAHAFGAALHGIGAQTISKGTLVSGVTYFQLEKSNGTNVDGVRERERMDEISVDLMYGLTNQVTLKAAFPWVQRKLDATGEDTAASRGFSDASIGAIYQLKPGNNDKILTAFNFDIKLPTGSNNVKDVDGALSEEHLQLGTGTVDYSAGFSISAEGPFKFDVMFAGAHYRFNGTSKRHFHYGDAFFYNAGFLHHINSNNAIALEIVGRHADKDKQGDGSFDDNSGGHILYFSPSVRRNLGKGFGLVLSWQVPIVQSLHGTQKENTSFTLGISRSY